MRTLWAFSLLLSLCGCGDDGGSGSGGSGATGGAGAGGAGGTAGSSTAGCAKPEATIVDPTVATELAIAGDPGAAQGTFDVSTVYPVGAPAGAMSYSAVAAKNDIASRIAVSADAGATWVFAAAANAASDVTVSALASATRCPGGSCSGRLIHEVSALAFDPEDPDAARRWKLFTHSYVVLAGDELAYDYGYISLFVAAGPEGPWSFESKAVGWQGEATLSSEGAATLAAGELGDCLALTEPSALVLPGARLELALGCATAQSIRIVLLESADHAKTFAYRGVLLDGDDATCRGGASPRYNAAHLFVAQEGRRYLLATTTGNVAGGFEGYRGCHLFELDGAGVVRSPEGDPIVLRAFDAAGDRFNGACDVAEGADQRGLAISILRLDAPPRVFRTYATGLALP
jgi:hypothetical protein